ncbi:SafA/ExsA family spore coat assembly protein [Virgibacillus sp. NKC19-3]|uniref:SafA/ExsA family spore coat assembly protein n=1 Tax=Virgibacillus saliphilus TaxID=2831674 RepID=UPI001C9A3B52|nr:SafA/ExsA family spore coat assembly protein [Virgibacillus sp. NKC19-3]MBY7143266.1 SafA/ExsA family spore coat assembly protein [Virgibacillus sp. NKC19-3]
MKIHIVQKGDTLWEISKSYGVDFEQVKELNSQLSSPDMIMPGMKIKIPGSSKTVKKEDTSVKETYKEQQVPYKDISPKPMPVIKEDDKEKPKTVEPQIPVEPLPKMPIQKEKQKPIEPLPKMPSQKEKPIQKEKAKPMLEQDHYTTVDFPKIKQQYTETKDKIPEKADKDIKPKPHPQPPMQQPMPMPMVPMCCHIVHPCYPPAPFPAMGAVPEGFGPPPQPMIHPDFHPQMPGAMMQPKKDCGCGQKDPFMPPQPMPSFEKEHHQHFKPQYGNENMHEFEFHRQMPPSAMYPPHFGDGSMKNHPYPDPPAYPEFSPSHQEEDEDKHEHE